MSSGAFVVVPLGRAQRKDRAEKGVWGGAVKREERTRVGKRRHGHGQAEEEPSTHSQTMQQGEVSA